MKAFIIGISGQDGAYLAQLLLNKGYQVFGGSRDPYNNPFSNLKRLGVCDRLQFKSISLSDFRSVLQAVKEIEPGEIYNLGGQSSVGLSFELPIETFESIATGTLNLLESIRYLGKPIKLYNACSSECFGDVGDMAADEGTPFRPRSPYAVAKASAFWQIANYREAYGLFACSGILFNHESPLRPERFVTRKIIAAAARIASGSRERLRLGNMAIQRDWGWAPEYADAMWRMLQQETPDDYVIGTGETNSLEELVHRAFRAVGLDWKDHIDIDPGLFRPSDLVISRSNPAKAFEKLNWQARYKMGDVVRFMLESTLNPL